VYLHKKFQKSLLNERSNKNNDREMNKQSHLLITIKIEILMLKSEGILKKSCITETRILIPESINNIEQ
jgi:hypothetical protein